MSNIEKFEVNKFISLQLKGKNTVIYVLGKKFLICKSLLFTNPREKSVDHIKINSIDEAELKLERDIMSIHPKMEFWGHCSNLQVWAENNYDTRLLHRNLAFPLFKKLTEVGDSIALKSFKKEIVKRLESGFLPVVWFLEDGNYLDYLTHEEQVMALLYPEVAENLFELEQFLGMHLNYIPDIEGSDERQGFSIENKKLKILGLNKSGLKMFPTSITNFSSLEELNLDNNLLKSLPESISNFTSLKRLYLENNKLSIIPKSIGDLNTLELLVLKGNQLKKLPDSIGNLSSLKVLNLEGNQLKILPDSIKNLTSLKFLDLEGNNFETLP